MNEDRNKAGQGASQGSPRYGAHPAGSHSPNSGQSSNLSATGGQRSTAGSGAGAPRGQAPRRFGPPRGPRPQGGAPQTNEVARPTSRVKHSTTREKQRTRRVAPSVIGHKDLVSSIVPPLKEGNIRIIHLGGVEEIGRNMSMIEIGDDIIVIDAGVQFSEESTPGIDFVLPNVDYLEERKHRIRGVLITHGHLDHIGGIPYLLEKIGNPPIYTRNFTSLMIQKRQEEFPHLKPLDFRLVEHNETRTLGKIKVNFFGVTHAIPDSMGIVIETPYGDIVHTGDLRLDHTEGEPSETETEVYEYFKDRNVLLLMADSTNVENPGFSLSEKIVYQNIEEIIKNTPGRLILSTFASQVERMLKIIEIAEKYGKKIAVEGRSMKTNIEVAKLAKLLTANPATFITSEEMVNYPPDRIIALVTGAQGEEFAALMRIANKTHKHIRLTPRDTILMSSSIIPGNERSIQKLKDNLSRQGAHIISGKTSEVHSSGHANQDELMWIHRKINPKFFIPVHGYHYMLRVHKEVAMKSLGLPSESVIIPDNGMVIEIQDNGSKIVGIKEYSASRNPVFVDGFTVGGMQEVVLRDRQTLAQNGIFVIVATLDVATGKITKSPDIISRGFVYLRESQELLRQARYLARKTIEDITVGKMGPNKQVDFDYLKDQVTEAIERLLFQETAKLPIVIPVILTV